MYFSCFVVVVVAQSSHKIVKENFVAVLHSKERKKRMKCLDVSVEVEIDTQTRCRR